MDLHVQVLIRKQNDVFENQWNTNILRGNTFGAYRREYYVAYVEQTIADEIAEPNYSSCNITKCIFVILWVLKGGRHFFV